MPNHLVTLTLSVSEDMSADERKEYLTNAYAKDNLKHIIDGGSKCHPVSWDITAVNVERVPSHAELIADSIWKKGTMSYEKVVATIQGVLDRIEQEKISLGEV